MRYGAMERQGSRRAIKRIPFEEFLHTLSFDIAHAEFWYTAVEENEEGLELIRFISFLQQYYNVIDYVIGPDTIGNPEVTYQAWQIFQCLTMTDSKAIPVFHYGSDPSHLKRYISDGFNYIALGGTVLKRKNNGKGVKVEIASWINAIINSYPTIKFHMLGSQDTYFLKTCLGLASMDGTAFSIGAGKDTVRQGRKAKVRKTIQNIERKEKWNALKFPVFQPAMGELLGFDSPHYYIHKRLGKEAG